ncbi:hypothetical protein KUTeg_019884 [Tegillarca granosa]|uniref:Uncharacterized protein n=1 Tax=Tegillarca granosa TaxID=220873 RepID=A0ABQ9EDW3_TEGGR|nr:hypothetical protein KUTeg_019884 [Tegillarca granosa]
MSDSSKFFFQSGLHFISGPVPISWVYVIAGTDPTEFLACIVDRKEDKTSLYVRGDDMCNFPSRDLCEKLMPVKFLPYTAEVSSTKLRKEMYNSSKFGPHVNHEDHAMFY